MEKATRFKKTRVIALDAGRFVGQVGRLILDLGTRHVAGLVLDGGEQAVDGEDLHSLGEDAVTITSVGRLIDLKQSRDLAAFLEEEEEVYRKEVFTVAGKKVGFITDVLIDPPTKRVVGFEMFSECLFPGEVHGVVLLDDQVVFGRDLVLVPAHVEELIGDLAVAKSVSPSTSPDTPLPSPDQANVFQEPSQLPEDIVAMASADGSPETIDFSGVEAPRPEVMRVPPQSQEQSPEDAGEERPDMQRLFANLSEGLTAEPEPEPEPQPAAAAPSSPKDKLILAKGALIDEAVVVRAQAAELMPQVFLAASQGLQSRLKRG